MPHLVIVSAAESSQRRLLVEAVEKARSDGYDVLGSSEETDWNGLFADAMTAGLFSSRSARVIEKAEAMGKFPDSLIPSLEARDADYRFILLYGGGYRKFFPKDAIASSSVEEAEQVPFWPSQRTKWLLGRARSLRIDLEYDAASLMVEWVEEPEELLSVLSTLGNFADGGTVDCDMVEKLVLNQEAKGMLRLLDGFCARKAGKCLQGFLELRETGDVIPTMAALHKRVRFAVYLSLTGGGDSVEKAFGMTKYQARQARDAAGRYDSQELKDLLAGVISLSMAERTGAGEGWAGFERLVLQSM